MRRQQSARKSAEVSVILVGGSQLFYTPEKTGTIITQHLGSAQNPPTSTSVSTPKTSVIFNDSNDIKVGYLGKLYFLENQ